jgi:hypothetical protein
MYFYVFTINLNLDITMKNLNSLFTMTAFIFAVTFASAQDSDWRISFGLNAIDTYSTGAASSLDDFGFEAGALFEDFLVVNNWSVEPSITYGAVSKSIGDNFRVGVRASYNSITKLGGGETGGRIPTESLKFYNADATVSYTVLTGKKVEPYLESGIGYTQIDGEGNAHLNFGAGATYWIGETMGLTYSNTMKLSQESNVPKHWQHLLGLTFKL